MGSRFLSLPSSKLGRVAATVTLGSIAVLIAFTASVAQGREEDLAWWQAALFVGVLVALLASWVMGLIAVLRNHERSWLVVIPTVLLSLGVANEVVQGVLQLLGLGGE